MGIPFKEARTGHIPSEWRTASLKDVCHKEVDRFEPRESGRVYPYVGLEHIESHTHKLNGHGQSNETLSTKNMFRANHILYGKLRPYLNKVWKAEFDGVCTTEILVISSRDEIEQDYLYQLLQRKHFVEYANSMTEGTSLPRIDWGDICSYEIALPPLPEQRKIAAILSTVDETIEKTDAIIQETQQLKKGLMQKLFTEGIGHTQFKETKIGRMPEEWEVVRFNQCLQKTRQKDPTKKPDEKFTYIDVSAVSNEFFKIVESKTILGKDAPSRARKGIKTGDTIYATVRPYLRRVAFVPSELDGEICSTGYCVVRPKPEEISHRFIFQLMLTYRVNGYLESLQAGTSYPAISDSDVYQMLIPKPPLPEQRRIAEILSEVDARIETERAFRSELEKLKKGLMQVLLTGKVRVKV